MILYAVVGWSSIPVFASNAPAAETKHVFEFGVTFPKETMAEAFTGRVVIFLSKYDREPRFCDRGHSGGGGATLRLMLNYPDFFGYGCASSPSPVDYRDVQGANIYEPGANLFYDAEGELRPVVRIFGTSPVAYFKEMSERDEVLGRGEARREREY